MMKRSAQSSMRLPIVLIVAAAVIVVLVLGIRAILHKPSSASNPKTPAVVVVVDPAHGGSDGGSVSEGVLEKNITLAVATKMSAMASEFPTLRLVLTRSSDFDTSDADRLALASREAAQLYVAIHVNAFSQPTALGIETLVDSTHKAGDASWTFADSIQKAVIAATGAKDRGVKAQGSTFSRLTIPAASTLVGFVTTPEERTKLIESSYQESLARGILQGVAAYVASAGVTPASAPQTIPLDKGQTAKPTASGS